MPKKITIFKKLVPYNELNLDKQKIIDDNASILISGNQRIYSSICKKLSLRATASNKRYILSLAKAFANKVGKQWTKNI